MSLLLNALKQAEANKNGQQEKSLNINDPQPETERTLEAEADKSLVELEVLPAFDLSLEESLDTTPPPISKELGDTSNGLPIDDPTVEPIAPEQNLLQENEKTLSIQETEPSIDNQNIKDSLAKEDLAHEQEELSSNSEQELEAAKSILELNQNDKQSNLWIWLVGIVISLVIIFILAYFFYLSIESGNNLTSFSTQLTNEWTIDDENLDEEVIETFENEVPSDKKNGALSVMANPETSINKTQNAKVLEKKYKEFLTKEASSDSSTNKTKLNIKIKRHSQVISTELNQAYHLYSQQRYAESSRLYQQVLNHNPKNINALLGLGGISEKQGNIAAAKYWYQKTLQLDNSQDFAKSALIRLQTNKSHIEKEVLLKQILKNQPKSASSYASLAKLYVSQKRWRDAQNQYFKAVEMQPNNVLYLYNLAICLEHINKPNIALNYYQKLLPLISPENASIDKQVVTNRIKYILGEQV